MRLIAFGLVVFVLSGCGTWVNRQHPNANYQADWHDCYMRAQQWFPPDYEVITTPQVTNTDCNEVYAGHFSCTGTTTGGTQ